MRSRHDTVRSSSLNAVSVNFMRSSLFWLPKWRCRWAPETAHWAWPETVFSQNPCRDCPPISTLKPLSLKLSSPISPRLALTPERLPPQVWMRPGGRWCSFVALGCMAEGKLPALSWGSSLASASANSLVQLRVAGKGLHSVEPGPEGWRCHEEAGVGRASQLLRGRPRRMGKFRQMSEGTKVHTL